MYILRLDDASEYMDLDKWLRMKRLLDKYGIKPIYGIIPNNQDPDLLQYEKVENFWGLMRNWRDNGWIPALHGFTHVFETEDGGINPVNPRSEFAGIPLEQQREKIKAGYRKLVLEGIKPEIFFAPAHTFDMNTLRAIYRETPIRVVNDTIANDVYYKKPFYFIPQQSGRVRRLPFKTVTFCYHPNTMKDEDFERLDKFIQFQLDKFQVMTIGEWRNKKYSVRDSLLSMVYFFLRK